MQKVLLFDPNVKLSKQTKSSSAERSLMSKVPFRELIGSLQYLANVTRFDDVTRF